MENSRIKLKTYTISMFNKCRNIPRRRWRNLISFWCFGLGNNFSYVIMLSAALDIIRRQEKFGPEVQIHKSPFNCTETGTASVLLADIIPSMVVKFVAPMFIHRLHFHIKILLSCALALGSFIVVSYSSSLAISLLGIVSASLSCGIGDVSFLSMTAFFHKDCVSAWSSGTGAAGLVGALVYASLTTATSPEKTLLIVTVVPITMILVYFFLLDRPEHAKFRYSMSCSQKSVTLSLPHESVSSYRSLEDHTGRDHIDSSRHAATSHNPRSGFDVQLREVGSRTADASSLSGSEIAIVSDPVADEFLTVEQIHPSWTVKWSIFRSLSGLLIFLSLVYFFEYLINQSLFELLYFPYTMSAARQYRWYQVLYQTGVFFSRSSVNLVQLKRTWMMAILQGINFVICLTQVIYQYIPSIWIMFILILYEGCLGGLAYVNTFYRIIQETTPVYREYAMTVSTIADSIGITAAGFLALPLHQWLCRLLR